MIETIATAVLIHLGKRLGDTVLDRFWSAQRSGNSAVVDQSGTLGYTSEDRGRTLIRREYTVPARQQALQLFGEFYLADELNDTVTGNEVPVVLIFEENPYVQADQLQTLLFDAELLAGYEVYLPPGQYTSYVFLIDGTARSFSDAQILAIGLPSVVDVSGFDEITFEDPEDIWEMVEDSPLRLTGTGPYYQDFILFETERILGYPASFADLLMDEQAQHAGSTAMVACLRCGGDGYVGQGDLEWLRAHGHDTGDWDPGPCLLCGGRGSIPSDFLQYRDVGNTEREQRYMRGL